MMKEVHAAAALLDGEAAAAAAAALLVVAAAATFCFCPKKAQKRPENDENEHLAVAGARRAQVRNSSVDSLFDRFGT